MRSLALATLLLAPYASLPAQESWNQGYPVDSTPAILPQRDRAAAVNRMLRDRLENLLPKLMRETGIDMWLVIAREYNEDPVYLSLVPEPVFAARRTTMLMFFDRGPGEGVEQLAVSRYGIGDLYTSAWDGGTKAEQWSRLAEVVAERKPKRIGINSSEHWAFGDGLSAGLRVQLEACLSAEDRAKLVSAEALCIRWLETRTEMEMEVYPQIVQIARSVIAEAFSNKVITPGVTTTADVAWFIRQRYSDMGLDIWFQPSVNLQRPNLTGEDSAPIVGRSGMIIERGDVLHTDVGITYLRLNTDTQEMAYVLRPDEASIPEGLVKALAVGNRWQDLLTGNFVADRSGNEILAATREACASEGIVSSTYTHPIGFHGHAAGPTIGMWDNQGPTPIRGDWLLHADTCYAIEGNVRVPLPEWSGQKVQIKLEQDAVFDGEQVTYIGGRQTRWHLIR
ncbi:MAG: M24 family metallopeptidase [Planctomycetota bacterium]|jgi:hypothetical protein